MQVAIEGTVCWAMNEGFGHAHGAIPTGKTKADGGIGW